MIRFSAAVLILRALLALLFLGLVVAQTLIMPGTLAHMATEDPEFAYLQWPLLAFSVIELLCVQVVIVCTWQLLTMVTRDQIFSDRAFRWVDAILGAMALAWVLLAGLFIYIGSIATDPGALVLIMGMLLAGGVLLMLMYVMRALLQQATFLRTDLEAVI
ncbi:MAG: DUF2975 domain-containing protein [Actinomycetota bacterium]|nr:DUF2975 domain-containing protein [Actinomycetota bacterium]